jgi:hypothetical protein
MLCYGAVYSSPQQSTGEGRLAQQEGPSLFVQKFEFFTPDLLSVDVCCGLP